MNMIQQDLKFVAKRKDSPAFEQIWRAFKQNKFNPSLGQGNGNKAWKRLRKIRKTLNLI